MKSFDIFLIFAQNIEVGRKGVLHGHVINDVSFLCHVNVNLFLRNSFRKV